MEIEKEALDEWIRERIDYIENLDYGSGNNLGFHCSTYCLDCNVAYTDFENFKSEAYLSYGMLRELAHDWFVWHMETGGEITFPDDEDDYFEYSDGSRFYNYYARPSPEHDEHDTFHFCIEGGSLGDVIMFLNKTKNLIEKFSTHQ